MSVMNTQTPDTLIETDPVAVEQLIADVLCGAHRTAQDLGAPEEARAIFHVAHAFADALAAMNSEFDRVEFIKAATDDRNTP
jgi:hypothetical protein